MYESRVAIPPGDLQDRFQEFFDVKIKIYPCNDAILNGRNKVKVTTSGTMFMDPLFKKKNWRDGADVPAPKLSGLFSGLFSVVNEQTNYRAMAGSKNCPNFQK